MDSVVQFLFRGKLFTAEFYFDTSPEPCYIFCSLKDEELIKEFGEELTIKTDFEKLLPKKDDYKQLVELRQAIFMVVKNTSVFQKLSTQGKVKG